MLTSRAVARFIAVSSFMNDLAGESLEPFFLMVLRDYKTRCIPNLKSTSALLNQRWSVWVTCALALSLSLSISVSLCIYVDICIYIDR